MLGIKWLWHINILYTTYKERNWMKIFSYLDYKKSILRQINILLRNQLMTLKGYQPALFIFRLFFRIILSVADKIPKTDNKVTAKRELGMEEKNLKWQRRIIYTLVRQLKLSFGNLKVCSIFFVNITFRLHSCFFKGFSCSHIAKGMKTIINPSSKICVALFFLHIFVTKMTKRYL